MNPTHVHYVVMQKVLVRTPCICAREWAVVTASVSACLLERRCGEAVGCWVLGVGCWVLGPGALALGTNERSLAPAS